MSSQNPQNQLDDDLPQISITQLEAFLDESLPSDEMSRIEQQLRDHPELTRILAQVIQRRDSGVHSIGGIWRRHRMTCPDRERLGAFLLGTLGPDEEDYLDFHLNVIGCRFCRANLEDLQSRQQDADDTTQVRRRRYFQSSAGYLKPKGS